MYTFRNENGALDAIFAPRFNFKNSTIIRILMYTEKEKKEERMAKNRKRFYISFFPFSSRVDS